MTAHLRLGVNIDHVATIRNARGGQHPDPVRAATLAVRAGADGITAHLREDRRHISDDDITRLGLEVDAPLNLEMAATGEMLRIALRHQPLGSAGIRVTLFIEPSIPQVEASAALGAHAVELHTGAWCHAGDERRAVELARIEDAAHCASARGIECHAGHGLSYDNVGPVAAVPEIVELNIGHFLIGEAIFLGLEESIARMRALMDQARRRG